MVRAWGGIPGNPINLADYYDLPCQRSLNLAALTWINLSWINLCLRRLKVTQPCDRRGIA
jgi:hypothetical protein